MNADRSEGDTEAFYAQLCYPGPAALITTVFAQRIRPFVNKQDFRFLDAGCGSGRHMAGLLKTFPQCSGIGIDLSVPSLTAAQALVDAIAATQRARFMRASFSEPIDIGEQVDIALAIGTIHHSPDPHRSLCNIAATVRPGGLVVGMVYGRRSHARRYEIREMLELLAPDDPETRLSLYRDYAAKYLTWLDRTPRQLRNEFLVKLARWRNRLLGRESDSGYITDPLSDVFLRDALLTPIDVAFDTAEVRRMLDGASLSLIEFLTLGKRDPALLPQAWRARWRALDPWQQVRVNELIHPVPTSLSFVARKT